MFARILHARTVAGKNTEIFPIRNFTISDIYRIYQPELSRRMSFHTAEMYRTVVDTFWQEVFDHVIEKGEIIDTTLLGTFQVTQSKTDIFVTFITDFRRFGGKRYTTKDLKNRDGGFPHFIWRNKPVGMKSLSRVFYARWGYRIRRRLMERFYDEGQKYAEGKWMTVRLLQEYMDNRDKYEMIRVQYMKKKLLK